MHLRTSLVTAAAIVAAGLIGLSSTAFATTGTVTGQFQSGSSSFAGSTYGCTSGTVAGSYNTSNPAFNFSTLSLNCSTPVGTATVSLVSPCTVPVTLTTGRTTGLDTTIGGGAAFGTGNCVKVSALFGTCTAFVYGGVSATFDETIKTGGWQDLTLNGSGTLVGASPGCAGLLSGTFTLVGIDFNLKPTSGLTSFNFA